MPKSITLTDIQITDWTVNVESQYVHVQYRVIDDQGEIFSSEDALFWVTLPPEGHTLPDGSTYTNPDNYFQLPLSYAQTLLDLTNDARTAIANKFINGLP